MIAWAMIVCAIFMMTQPIIAFAAEREVSFDNTDVMEDLMGSTVDGKPFDIARYPYREEGKIQVLSFVEYCYSFRGNERENYGLYLYVYNPGALNLSTDSQANKVEMAVAYDENGVPTRYEKFPLVCCGKVTEGDYKNLFYKFKVVDKEVEGTTFATRVESNARRYDLSGIEFMTYGDRNATEYGIGGTYVFSGYAQGYGPDRTAESTLTCSVTDLETLELEVHHTNFRSNVSALGKDHYNDVNTVYFAVPEEVYEEYGRLQKIRAEWWEYQTKMAAITSNKDFYEEMLLYIGTDVGVHDPAVPFKLYTNYSGNSGIQIGQPSIHNYDWVYNVDVTTKHSAIGTVTEIHNYKKQSTILPFVFYSPVADVDTVFDFLYSDPIAGDVKSTEVQEYIYRYQNDLGNGYIDCNGRKISKDLFEDSVDQGRMVGHNDVTVDLEDTFDLHSYDSNHSWWGKLWDYGFSWPATDGDYQDVSPIYEIKESDLVGTDDEISTRLLVNRADVSELKNFYRAQVRDGKRVVLFRFATTDYYCAPAFTPYCVTIDDTNTYVAQQTVFFDFDIIELTFNRDGVYRVIPAVASPTDIINGFTAPPLEFEWWKAIIAVLFLILLIVFIYPVIPYLIKLVVWIVLLPFKAVSGIAKRNKPQNEDKEE